MCGRGVPDPDCRGQGFGMVDSMAEDQWCRSRGLKGPHPWRPASDASTPVLRITTPVRGHVRTVADWQDVQVGSVPELVDDFERRCLLSLQTDGIDGIDKGDRVVLGQPPSQVQACIEVALDLYDTGPMHDRLGQL